jgi:hypothetical protein
MAVFEERQTAFVVNHVLAHRMLFRDVKRSPPVKILTTFGLVFCFYLFLGLALATQGQAEEYYRYKDPHGNLVISNKLPPTGSIVLKRYELPAATDPQVQPPHEASDAQLNEKSEGSAKPANNK